MRYDEFTEKLKRFCLDAGFEIAGTCESEGIYGEITIVRVGTDANWNRWNEMKFNFVHPDDDPVEDAASRRDE